MGGRDHKIFFVFLQRLNNSNKAVSFEGYSDVQAARRFFWAGRKCDDFPFIGVICRHIGPFSHAQFLEE